MNLKMNMQVSYGVGHVVANTVQEFLKKGIGEVVLKVILAPKFGSGEPGLAYGFFYRDPNGDYYDILQQQGGLKTISNTERAVHYMLSLNPKLTEVTVPVLNEENLLQAGGLR